MMAVCHGSSGTPEAMQVQVTPLHGFGWLHDGGMPMEAPTPFALDVTILAKGEPFKEAFGFVAEKGHELSGPWVWLWQRTTGDYPTYNLSVFADRPAKSEDFATARASITGFSTASRVFKLQQCPNS
jgi:hypothetical protein